MSTRLTGLLGLIVLISIGLLMACGSHYSSSSDGLLVVPSQGSAVLQSFSFNLSNGKAAQISAAPATNGNPSAIVLDPAGAFAYVLVDQNTIATFQVNSDGTLSGIGTMGFNQATVKIGSTPNTELVSVVPSALAMDQAGKFLFVADRETIDSSAISVPGGVSVFSIGGNAALTEVAGSPFFPFPPVAGGTQTDMVALAPTPTSFPTTTAACAMQSAPTTEYLYVVDANSDQVWAFAVDTSSGVLGVPAGNASILSFPTGRIPSAIAVDPCNRFVYVANQNSNNVSGYTICNSVSPNCPAADGSLVSVGPAASAGNGPTAIAVDPFGSFVYVVDTQSNAISGFKISQVSGTLSPLSTPLVATGATPVSIAIRADGLWLFVANNNSASVSQYAITPASGALAPLTAITTDNFPWGVAVR